MIARPDPAWCGIVGFCPHAYVAATQGDVEVSAWGWYGDRLGPVRYIESEVWEKEEPREPWLWGRLTCLGGLLTGLLTAVGGHLALSSKHLVNIELTTTIRISKRTE